MKIEKYPLLSLNQQTTLFEYMQSQYLSNVGYTEKYTSSTVVPVPEHSSQDDKPSDKQKRKKNGIFFSCPEIRRQENDK